MKILHVVLGYNHSFGKGKQGDIRLLSQWGENYHFGVTEVPCLRLGGLEISSSIIRKALCNGEITLANRLLGFPYFVRGGLHVKVSAPEPVSEPAFVHATVSADDRMLEISVCIDKLLPRCGTYLARWSQQKVQVTVKDSQKLVLCFNEKAPSLEVFMSQPLYFIKHL